MRARDCWFGGVLVACFCTGVVLAQATDDASIQFEPYNKHHDRHFGHDHVYPDRGSIFRDAPKGSTIINYAGLPYRFSNGVWFEPRGPAFIVVMPPIGVVVPSLPAFATPLELGGESYFYANDVYYLARPELGGYEVVNDPSDMAPTPARSGESNGGVAGESAVVKAAPLATAVPAAATGAMVAAGAANTAEPAAASVAGGTAAAAAPIGASAAHVAGGAPIAVSRSMMAAPGVASGATSTLAAAGTAASSVAAGPTPSDAVIVMKGTTVAVGPTHATTPGGSIAPAVAGDPAVPAAPSASSTPTVAAGGPQSPEASGAGAIGPTSPVKSATAPASSGQVQSAYPAAAAASTQGSSASSATAPGSAGQTQSVYPGATTASTSQPALTYAPSTPSPGSNYPATNPTPSGTTSPVTPPAAPAEAAKAQLVANTSPLSGPTATAPTVPNYGAPTYGSPTSTTPTATTVASQAATPPSAPPLPPGVTGIPILGSASAYGAPKPMAYPRNGQNQERQARDHYDCYQFGVAQSGYDPMRSGYGVASSGNQAEFARAQAACFEGRGYTVR